MTRLRRAVLGVVAATLTLSACTTAGRAAPVETGGDRSASLSASPSATAPTTPDTPPVSDAEVTRAATQLATLAVADRHPAGLPPYDRDAFGPAWADVDGNGCNQRDDVLLRDAEPESTTVQQQGRCDHDVLAGMWIDPYSGQVLVFTNLKDLHQAEAIQIDHVVPLAEAWVSGAAEWAPERRAAYANDVPSLLAVDGPTNASKGAGDPAAWRPKQAYQCAYAVRWIDVKTRWQLAVDASEVAALTDMLGTC